MFTWRIDLADMIKKLLQQQEGQCFDRKSIGIEPKALAVSLVALANADGGTIVIGVNDRGEVEGVAGHEAHINELLRVPYDFCKPTVKVDHVFMACRDRNGRPNKILVLTVHQSPSVHANQTYGFVKEFGEGIDRMCKELKEFGLPDPAYQVEAFMLRCTVKAADVGQAGSVPGQLLQPAQNGEEGPQGAESGPESGPESIFRKVLILLRSGDLSMSELAIGLGHKGISGKLKLRIHQMLDSGLIERTIPEKPNSRLQKYRLTPRGRTVMAKG